jgi:hypothetical protein
MTAFEEIQMKPFDEPTPGAARGLTRRAALCRLARGLAGALLAGLGLAGGRSPVQAARVVSLRAVLQQLDGGCDPSQGIRLMLPVEGPVISLLDVIHRYYHA